MSEMDVNTTYDDVDVDDAAETSRAEALDIEAPEADAVEQHTSVREDRYRDETAGVPFDADEADAAEQHEIVELDEDDYR